MMNLNKTLNEKLKDGEKYAIFNMIADYRELEYHYTSVFFSKDGFEQQEDRYKYTISHTPDVLFKSKQEVIREFLWLKKHYLVTSYFKIVSLDKYRTVFQDVVCFDDYKDKLQYYDGQTKPTPNGFNLIFCVSIFHNKKLSCTIFDKETFIEHIKKLSPNTKVSVSYVCSDKEDDEEMTLAYLLIKLHNGLKFRDLKPRLPNLFA